MWHEDKIALIRSGWVLAAITVFLTFVTAFPKEKASSLAEVGPTLATGIGLSIFLTALCLPIVYLRKFNRSELAALAGGGIALLVFGQMDVIVPWQGIVLGIFLLVFVASFLFSGPRFNR